MNNKSLFLTTLSIFFSFVLHAVEINKDIKIKSDSIEFLKENNQISFLNNVEIRSNSVELWQMQLLMMILRMLYQFQVGLQR